MRTTASVRARLSKRSETRVVTGYPLPGSGAGPGAAAVAWAWPIAAGAISGTPPGNSVSMLTPAA